MIPRGISDLKGRAAIAVVLAGVLALILAASASAGKPFPRIARDATVSCSQAKAKVSVTVTWRKANRKGTHRGHVVALVRGKRGRLLSRKVKSGDLRSARLQSIEYRFRFANRASRRLCNGKTRARVVASHAHDKDRAGLVEIYRVARRTFGSKAGASGELRAARTPGASGSGPADQEVTAAGITLGSDCQNGGANATIKEFAQLALCNLTGAQLPGANLFGANLTFATLTDANFSGANFTAGRLDEANFTGANLSDAKLESADLGGATLNDANLTGASLTAANLTAAGLNNANLTRADLTEADLVGSFFTGANLRFANLTEARIEGVSFFEADLTGANLTSATNIVGGLIVDLADVSTLLTDANCSGATKPDGSKYPAGTGDPPFFQC